MSQITLRNPLQSVDTGDDPGPTVGGRFARIGCQAACGLRPLCLCLLCVHLMTYRLPFDSILHQSSGMLPGMGRGGGPRHEGLWLPLFQARFEAPAACPAVSPLRTQPDTIAAC